MRRQLSVTSAAIASMIVLAFLVPLALLVATVAGDRALRGAEAQANALVPVLATVTDPGDLERVVAGVDTGDPGRVNVFLATGEVLGDDQGDRAPTGLALARTGRSFSTREHDGTALYVPVVLADRVHVIRAFVPDAVSTRGVHSAWAVLAALGVLLVFAALAVGDRLARQVVGPVRDLADVAGRLGNGDLAARVTPQGPPEIVEVGHTLNDLATRIGDLLTAERESIADLSHRLRTPVTALKLDAEAIADPTERARLMADVDELQAAVTKLINDARRTSVPAPAEADLVEAVRERVAFWAVLAEDQGRTYTLRLPDDACPVAVARDDLDAALDALLGNVLAHTPEGVAFHVLVRPVAEPDFAGSEVLLVDEGPGFTPEAMVGRGASGGGSTGLGLDIVRQTAAASHGRFDAMTGPGGPGGGARMRVRFGAPAVV